MKQIVVESDMRFVVDDAQVFRVEEIRLFTEIKEYNAL